MPQTATLFVIGYLLRHCLGERDAVQDLIPGQVVFAANDVEVADGGVLGFAVRWGDRVQIVERHDSSYRVKVNFRNRGMALGDLIMMPSALQLEAPSPRRGEWVQLARDLAFRSGRFLQKGTPCIVLDASADAGTASTQFIVVKVVSAGQRAAFDLSVASGDIEPMENQPTGIDEFDPDELAGGVWAGDVVFSLDDIAVIDPDKQAPVTIVGAGDVGVVFSPGLTPQDRQDGKVLVRFEARRDTLEPTYLNVHPTRLSRERPLMQGHLVQLTVAIQPPDAPAIPAGTIGSLVKLDTSGEGGDIVRIAGAAFMLQGGYASISQVYIADDNERARRFAELEEIAEAMAGAGQHMSIVSLLEQNMWPMFGRGLGVGLAFIGRRGPRRITSEMMQIGSVRPLFLEYRPSHGMDGTFANETTQKFNHGSLLRDVGRNIPYAAALARHSRGRHALDIGTGPASLWARAALLYGAASAEAVENTESTVRTVMDGFAAEQEGVSNGVVPSWVSLPVVETATTSDPETRGRRFSAKLQSDTPGAAAQEFRLYRGLSSDSSIGLSGGYTLIVHEILGDMAGTEGAAAVIADVRERGLVAQDCVFVPRVASTMIAPTSPLSMSTLERLLHRWGHGGEAEVRPLERCSARRFPSSAIIADPQPMEIVDFQGGPELVQERVLEFRTRADGYFDGVHLHLLVDLDDDARIDLLEQHNSDDLDISSNWSTIYVRLVDEALWLRTGSRIAVRCYVDLSGPVASYRISVWVGEQEGETHVADFSWSGA